MKARVHLTDKVQAGSHKCTLYHSHLNGLINLTGKEQGPRWDLLEFDLELELKPSLLRSQIIGDCPLRRTEWGFLWR